MSAPTELGAFRAAALRHYDVVVPADDLAELSQKEFDAIHQRSRESWEKAESARICRSNNWEMPPEKVVLTYPTAVRASVEFDTDWVFGIGIVGAVFVLLKLCDVVDWSWWLVTCLFWGVFAVIALAFLAAFLVSCWKAVRS